MLKTTFDGNLFHCSTVLTVNQGLAMQKFHVVT